MANADSSLYGLVEEWLTAQGSTVALERGDAGRDHGFDLVVVDVPFPRQGGRDMLERIAQAHPGIPIIALSSTFFDGIDRNGAVARSLGVASVLPKPVTRDSLLAAVSSLRGKAA